MADFLTTKGVSSKIEDIIKYSQEELILISPYYQLSDDFILRLREASDRGVDIVIVYGKRELDDVEFRSMIQLPTLELFYCHNLHAKCYLNEANMVITSMNMYAFSERNNREMGVFIDRKVDNDFYGRAKQEAISIIKSSELIGSNRPFNHISEVNNEYDVNGSGYCIRCGYSIPLNLKAPYCKKCYSTWNEFQNPNYEENICHSCGREEPTTLRKPVCYNCYR